MNEFAKKRFEKRIRQQPFFNRGRFGLKDDSGNLSPAGILCELAGFPIEEDPFGRPICQDRYSSVPEEAMKKLGVNQWDMNKLYEFVDQASCRDEVVEYVKENF